MSYKYHVPCAPLSNYIHCFYYRDQPMPYRREKILPMPWLNLMINFGGDFVAYEAEESIPFATCKESWWIGLWSAYHIVDWPPDIEFFIVDFKPGGAFPFLRLPLAELHDQVVPLDNVWGNFAAEIRERLSEVPSLDARFALLDELLLARLHSAPDGLNAVQYAIGQIAQQHGALSIRALSDHMGISQKHLITQFKRLVGGTPKELARMVRFQNVLYSIDTAQAVDLTQLAHEFCYYDQSHFNKDFEAFTGHTPGDYLRLRRRIHAENSDHSHFLRQLPIG